MNIVDRARSLVVPVWSDVDHQADTAIDTFASPAQSDFVDSDHETISRVQVVLPDRDRPGSFRAHRRGFTEVVGFGRDELEALDDLEAKERKLNTAS